MDDNRITEKKRAELTAKLLSGAMSDAELTEFNREYDKYAATPPAAASPAMFSDPSDDPAVDDDVYVPPQNSSIFDDEDVTPETDVPVPDAPRPALVGSNAPGSEPVDGAEDELADDGVEEHDDTVPPAEDSAADAVEDEQVVEGTDDVTDPLDLASLFSESGNPPATTLGFDSEPEEDTHTSAAGEDSSDDFSSDTDTNEDGPASPTPDDDDAFVAVNDTSPSIKDKITDWWEDLEPLHQKMVFGVGASAILLVVAFVILLVAGGDSEPDVPPVQTDGVAEEQDPVEEDEPDAAAGTLIPTGMEVTCPAGASTRPEDAFNPAEDTAWVCERAFGIDGTTLTLTFDSPVEISEVGMVPGFDYVAPRGVDEWNNHRVVTRALWRIGDEQFVQEINPTRADVVMTVPDLTVQRIQLTIQATDDPVTANGGNANAVGGADTFAISRIIINGKPTS